MNQDEIQQLTHIRKAQDASKKIYRYAATVNYYHPRCILTNEMLLVDYRNLCKYCIENIANKEINAHPQQKFIIPDDLEKLKYLVHSKDIKFHNLTELTVQQAQEIINANIVAMQELQTQFEEYDLIKQIERI